MKNQSLLKAQNSAHVSSDESYTKIESVEDELRWYDSQLCGKVIYLPCDNYRDSAFYTYFLIISIDSGLKK